jgi:ubiquinol-cytochrome c reductase cytochrome c subunit
MRTIIRTGLFAFAAVALASAALAAPAETGNAANGKKLFMENLCYSCHGTMGAGGGGAGPKLAPQPLPMAAFIHQLRSPLQRMPPYTEKVLSDAAVADIHAYLASIPRDKPAAEIPLLKR